jgi:hypothetical protein
MAVETDSSQNECKDKVNKSGAASDVVSVRELILHFDSSSDSSRRGWRLVMRSINARLADRTSLDDVSELHDSE